MPAENFSKYSDQIRPYLSEPHQKLLDEDVDRSPDDRRFFATYQEMLNAVSKITTTLTTIEVFRAKLTPEQLEKKKNAIKESLAQAAQLQPHMEAFLANFAQDFPEYQSETYDKFKDALKQLQQIQEVGKSELLK